ncbi:ABC transporter ATP-binding protein, partial [Polaromonas hydrogenivorans]
MFLEVTQLGVHYAGSAHAAVDGVSFSLAAGEIGVLIGPSGCGKTTLLRAVAGLERAHAGTIRLAKELVSSPRLHVPAESRKIGMVFQDYALFPHLNIASNVAFGLTHLNAAARSQRVDEVLELVSMGHAHKRFPHELSGGQQQRVALA